MCACVNSERLEEDVEYPGTEVIGVCETPDMAAGNKTQFLWRGASTLYHWVISPAPTESNSQKKKNSTSLKQTEMLYFWNVIE